LVEHRSPKPRVVGSSPPTPAKLPRPYAFLWKWLWEVRMLFGFGPLVCGLRRQSGRTGECRRFDRTSAGTWPRPGFWHGYPVQRRQNARTPSFQGRPFWRIRMIGDPTAVMHCKPDHLLVQPDQQRPALAERHSIAWLRGAVAVTRGLPYPPCLANFHEVESSTIRVCNCAGKYVMKIRTICQHTQTKANFPIKWCCKRGLNSRPLPYQGSALPLSYCSAVSGVGQLPLPAWRVIRRKRRAVQVQIGAGTGPFARLALHRPP
jgi:hypothetical protein